MEYLAIIYLCYENVHNNKSESNKAREAKTCYSYRSIPVCLSTVIFLLKPLAVWLGRTDRQISSIDIFFNFESVSGQEAHIFTDIFGHDANQFVDTAHLDYERTTMVVESRAFVACRSVNRDGWSFDNSPVKER